MCANTGPGVRDQSPSVCSRVPTLAFLRHPRGPKWSWGQGVRLNTISRPAEDKVWAFLECVETRRDVKFKSLYRNVLNTRMEFFLKGNCGLTYTKWTIAHCPRKTNIAFWGWADILLRNVEWWIQNSPTNNQINSVPPCHKPIAFTVTPSTKSNDNRINSLHLFNKRRTT